MLVNQYKICMVKRGTNSSLDERKMPPGYGEKILRFNNKTKKNQPFWDSKTTNLPQVLNIEDMLQIIHKTSCHSKIHHVFAYDKVCKELTECKEIDCGHTLYILINWYSKCYGGRFKNIVVILLTLTVHNILLLNKSSFLSLWTRSMQKIISNVYCNSAPY